MSKKSSKTSDIFKPKGKPPKGKARIHLIAVVYPDGAVGIAWLEKGNSISEVACDARGNAEDDTQDDGVIGDAGERDSNLAFYQVELVLTKPIAKPVQTKPAKAKTTKLADVKTGDGDEEPDNEGVVHPEEEEDGDDGDEHLDDGDEEDDED